MIRFLQSKLLHTFLLLLMLGTVIHLGFQDTPAIQRIRNITFDNYNRIFPRLPDTHVAIVDIDEDALKEFGQWPWPRPLIADLPVILREMGAKAVAFDIVFSEPDRISPPRIAKTLPAEMPDVIRALEQMPDNDETFAEKIKTAGNVVLGFSASDLETDFAPHLSRPIFNVNDDVRQSVYQRPYFISPLPVLAKAAAGNGSFTAEPETDGIIRSVPLLIGQMAAEEKKTKVYPALAVETLRVALKKNIFVELYPKSKYQAPTIKGLKIGDYEIPTDPEGRLRVYYTGHRRHLYISAREILNRTVNPDRIKDKIIIIGTSANTLKDLRSSPLDKILPGVEIHAEIIEQMLTKQFLHRPFHLAGAELIAVGAVGLLIILLAPFIGIAWLAFISVTAIGSAITGSLYAYNTHGFVIDPVYPSLGIFIIFIAASLLNNLRTELEKRAVRDAFGLYLSPVLIEELAKNPDKLTLGGEVRDLSVMFTDIRNFTSISETMDPKALINLMNDFLTPMTSAVLNNRGTVDKYMGDAMMAFWNAPLDDPDHAGHACQTALEMLKALEGVNTTLRTKAELEKKPFKELKAGIGINTGRASVGNMGSKQRFAYSALGDSVNLASRLEGQTKGYGISVMISETTRAAAPEFAAIEIDLLTVKGRLAPVRVYALLGDAAEAARENFKAFSNLHDDMLASYRAQKWDDALDKCATCEKVRPDLASLYALYRDRIENYRENPPGAPWQGVWIAKEK